MRLILASASPRRAELLRSAGYTFDVVVADVDESIREGESPWTYVRRLAAEKSTATAITRGAALAAAPPLLDLVGMRHHAARLARPST